MQRCALFIVASINVGAVFDKDLRGVHVSLERSPMQRRPVIIIITGHHRGAVGNEELRDVCMAILCCNKECFCSVLVASDAQQLPTSPVLAWSARDILLWLQLEYYSLREVVYLLVLGQHQTKPDEKETLGLK